MYSKHFIDITQMHEIIVYKKPASAIADIKSTTSTNDRPKQGRYL